MSNQSNYDPTKGDLFEFLNDIRKNEDSNKVSNHTQLTATDTEINENADTIGEIVETTSNQLVSPYDRTPGVVLDSYEGSLKSIQKFLYNQQIGKLKRNEALKIAKVVFEHEFQATFQKLTLALDVEKKRTFIRYMQSTMGLQRELQQLDMAACTALSQSLLDINTQIYNMSNRNNKTIDQLLHQGVITPLQAEHERAKNSDLCKRNLEGAMKTFNQMWNNHKQLLEQTLRGFFNQLTAEGKLK